MSLEMARRGLATRVDECLLVKIADVEQSCRNDGSWTLNGRLVGICSRKGF